MKDTKKNIKKKTNKKKGKKKNSFFDELKKRLVNAKKDLLGQRKNSASFSLFEVIIIILISILFGGIMGYLIDFSKTGAADSNSEEIIETYNNIVSEYYDDIDKDKLSEAAIKGMINSLDDPYSNYMDTETTDKFNESIDGTFVGIGVVVMYDGEYNTIIEVYDGEPAKKAGLLVDDKIIKVDGKDVKSVYGDELVKLIRGKLGTIVKVTVLRGEEEKEFEIKRGNIDILSVSDKTFDVDGKKIGYIRIDTFAANTYSQFNKTLKRLEKDNINSLIIDVRDNPGGHLLQTRQMLSLFFNKKTVLYQIKDKLSNKKVYSYSNSKRSYPIAVLVNGGSASASEILASCFKENYKKATIVGTKTYGKGTVQKSIVLSNGKSIKYTTEKWLTSKGKWINKKGIKPDVEVELNDAYFENPSDENDNQLQEAINKLKESN